MFSNEYTRRSFLGVAGMSILAAGASDKFSSVKGQSPSGQPKTTAAMVKGEPMPPEKRLGWAIVGVGDFASNQLIPSFPECKMSKLVALVSGDRAKAERVAAQNGVNAKNIYDYKNYDSIKDNPEVDVIYIVLPNSMHAEYTIRGAQAGKHIMCEKPMATSVKDCERMIEACRKANKKLMIAYRAQYEPYNLEAIKMAKQKELGPLKMIVADHGRILDPSKPRDQWRAKKDLAGGGSLMDIGVYSLNAARYLTGEEPVELSAFIHSTPNDPRFREVEENVSFTLRFPSGVIANCSSSYGYADTKRYRVLAERGWFELDPATDYYEHRMRVGTEEGVQDKKIQEENQFALEIDHLSECIMQNKIPRTPGEEGLQDVRLMMAIYEAARSGKKMNL